MRLIDADALIEGRVENDPVRIAVQCAPTAYNLDAVVEQLESLSNAEADYYYARSNDVIDRETAIDIVRSGGKD